jgi:hypothetical protein
MDQLVVTKRSASHYYRVDAAHRSLLKTPGDTRFIAPFQFSDFV